MIDGKQARTVDIENQIELLKKSFQSGDPDLLNLIVKYTISWLDIFTNEIELQTYYASESFKQYLELKNCNNIKVKEIFKEIHHFVIHAANVSKLAEKLREPKNSIKTQILSQIINTTSFDLKILKYLRNHLEHYEERLEAWFYLHCGTPIFDMNIVGSNTKGVDFKKCLRVLNIDEDKYYILGEEFDLRKLYKMINAINNSLKNNKLGDHLLEGTR